jgi:hypothetical protein
MARPLL